MRKVKADTMGVASVHFLPRRETLTLFLESLWREGFILCAHISKIHSACGHAKAEVQINIDILFSKAVVKSSVGTVEVKE